MGTKLIGFIPEDNLHYEYTVQRVLETEYAGKTIVFGESEPSNHRLLRKYKGVHFRFVTTGVSSFSHSNNRTNWTIFSSSTIGKYCSEFGTFSHRNNFGGHSCVVLAQGEATIFRFQVQHC